MAVSDKSRFWPEVHHRTLHGGILSSTRVAVCGLITALIAASTGASSSVVAAPNSGDTAQTASASAAKAGKISLKEYKKSITLQVNVSQSRLFTINHRIIRTSVADPGIAEPVVLAENVLLLLGKARGETTINIWDDGGCESGLSVVVNENNAPFQTMLLEMPEALLEHVRGTANCTSRAQGATGKLRLTECADPRTSKATMDNGEADPVAQATSRILAFIGTWPTADRKTQPRRPAQPHGNYKTQEDILSLPDGEKVAIDSGFKIATTTKSIDLVKSQSIFLHTENTIVKINTTDVGIAEPIVVSSHEFVLLGKHQGTTQFEITDDKGSSEAFDLIVQKRLGRFLSAIRLFSDAFSRHIGLQKANASFPPVDISPIDFHELTTTDIVELKASQPKFFKTDFAILRTSTADPGIAEPGVISTTQFALLGKTPGRTTIFLWDDAHNAGKIDVHIIGPPAPEGKTLEPFDSNISRNPASTQQTSQVKPEAASASPALSLAPKVEVWSGSRKDIISVLRGEEQDHMASDQPDVNVDFLKGLNNSGVAALARQDYEKAIKDLETALHYAPKYRTARNNLAVAYNNYGLTFQRNPDKAIPYFHYAVYLDPENVSSQGNLKGIIRKMGKDPDNFDDRVALGDEARAKHDTRGSVIEYEAALRIREDSKVRAKLDEAIGARERSGHLDRL